MRFLIILFLILSALIAKLVFSQTYSDITYDAGTTIDISTGADVCATNIKINGTYSGGGTICSGPLPVTLSSFEASVLKNNVKLVWVTEIETNNSGFYIELKIAPEGGIWVQIGFVQGSGTTNSAKVYTFEDKKLSVGTYKYRLKQLDYNGNYEYFELNTEIVIGKPLEYKISQNYPNPSNPKSKIDYDIPFNAKVSIVVYDLLGSEIKKLVDEFKEAGYYTSDFDGTNLASGVYFYRITAEGSTEKFSKTLKMIIVK
jgi:hypothetical protein